MRLILDDLRGFPGTWSSQVVLDCEWAAKQWGVALPQDLSSGFVAWMKAAALSSKWPDRCKTLSKYAKRNLRATHELRLWHVDLCEAFKMCAISVPDWMCGPVLASSELVCYECGATFASRTALAVHSRILHGSINAADQRVTGTICLRCRKQYHSWPRLVAHMQRESAECLAAYLDHVPPLDIAYHQELKKEDAVNRKKEKGLGLTDLHGVLRVVKIAGPRLPPPLPDTLELCRARLAVACPLLSPIHDGRVFGPFFCGNCLSSHGSSTMGPSVKERSIIAPLVLREEGGWCR